MTKTRITSDEIILLGKCFGTHIANMWADFNVLRCYKGVDSQVFNDLKEDIYKVERVRTKFGKLYEEQFRNVPELKESEPEALEWLIQESEWNGHAYVILNHIRELNGN